MRVIKTNFNHVFTLKVSYKLMMKIFDVMLPAFNFTATYLSRLIASGDMYTPVPGTLVRVAFQPHGKCTICEVSMSEIFATLRCSMSNTFLAVKSLCKTSSS